MDLKLVVGVSLVCQLAAAGLAVWLIPVTRRWGGWTVLALAMIVQAIRRGVVMADVFTDPPPRGDMALDAWLGLGVSATMLAAVAMLVPLFRAMRRDEQALARANADLLGAGEEQRRTLASELHDSLGHSLFALQLELQRGATAARLEAQPADLLLRSASQCGRVMDEVRHICHGLYPPTLESLGLFEALRQLAIDFGPSAAITVEADDPVRAARYAPQIEIACFRVAQEAISNAIRHGRARTVVVRLSTSGQHLELAIQDDGCGFDAKDERHGLGLATMRQRASALCGDLSIESCPGRTRVVLRVPAIAK